MAGSTVPDERHLTTDDDDPEAQGSHELPRGALVITIGYLVILTLLWVQVYLQLLNSGGIPSS